MTYTKYCQKITEKNYTIRNYNKFQIFYGLDSPQNRLFQNKAIIALKILHRAGLLSEDNAECIYSQPLPHKIYELIVVLNNTGLLGCPFIRSCLNLYLNCANESKEIVDILYLLQRNGWTNLINHSYFEALFAHPDTANLYRLLDSYTQTNSVHRFTQAECSLLINHPDPLIIIEKINSFHESNYVMPVHEYPLIAFIIKLELDKPFSQLSIPNQLITMIGAHECAWDIFQGVKLLLKMNCLRSKNIYALLEHSKPLYFISALQLLIGTNLIAVAAEHSETVVFRDSQTIIDLVAQHPQAHILNLVFISMRKLRLLVTEEAYEHFMLIINHPNLHAVANVLNHITQTALFPTTYASTYFKRLMIHNDPWLVNAVLQETPYIKRLDAAKMRRYFKRMSSADPKAYAARILVSRYPTLVRINHLGFIQLIDDDKAIIDTHVVWILSRARLLNDENVATLLACNETPLFTELLEILYNFDLLNDQAQNMFTTLMLLERQIPHEALGSHLMYLINVLLLSNPIIRELSFMTARQFIDELMEPKKTYPILMAFHTWMSYLDDNNRADYSQNLDTQLCSIAQHHNPVALAEAFIFMDEKGLLRGYSAIQNRLIVSAHTDPIVVAHALYVVQKNHVMQGRQFLEHRWLIGTHKQPEEAAYALVMLDQTATLNATNNLIFCTALARTSQPYSFAMNALAGARTVFDRVAEAIEDKLCMAFYPEYISSALSCAFELDSPSSHRFKLIKQLILFIDNAATLPKHSKLTPIHFFSKARLARKETHCHWANKWLNELIFYPKQSIAATFHNVLTFSAEGAVYLIKQQHGLPRGKEFNAIIDMAAKYAEVTSDYGLDDDLATFNP